MTKAYHYGFHQIGTTHRAADKRVSARKPGRRVAKVSKARYYENRRNRSDKNPRLRL